MEKDKYILLGDLHSGVSDGSAILMEHHLKYLEDVIEYAVENGIKTIIQTGDTMDVRTSMNTRVFSEWKKRFFDKLRDNGIILIMLVGNHDMYYKHVIHPNSPTEYLGGYENIFVIDRPTFFKPLVMLLVPWICKSNQEEIIEEIETTDAKILVGHFEIKGARMESGVCDSGLPLSMFEKFDMVYSGHFHIKGRYGNVEYVGTPYQSTWADLKAGSKGFHVFNEYGQNFIKNETELFIQVNYTDTFGYELFLDENDLKDKFVKIVVVSREDTARFERFMMKIEDAGCANLVVQEPFENRNHTESSMDESDVNGAESTSELLEDYVSEVFPERKTPVNKLMQRLLSQAQGKVLKC